MALSELVKKEIFHPVRSKKSSILSFESIPASTEALILSSYCNIQDIGNLIMEELRKLDQVAYVRFASVYREFKDLSSFMSELETLMKNGKTEGTDSKNDQN